MSTDTSHPDPLHDPAFLDRDVLVSRLIDGRGADADWLALRSLSTAAPAIWTDLADTQRQSSGLAAEIDHATAAADVVHLPHSSRRLRIIRPGALGWALAAVLTLAITLQFFADRNRAEFAARMPTTYAAGLFHLDSPAAALDAYKELGRKSGQVVGEIPQRIVIDTRQRTAAEGGGTEVTYLRQIVEKTVVDDVYRMGCDDLGKPVLVPATPAPSPATSGSAF